MFKSFYHGTTLTNAIGILNDMKRHNFLDWRKSESPWAPTCCNYDSLYLYDVFDRNVLWSAMMYAALTDYQGHNLCVIEFGIDESFLSKDEYAGDFGNAYMIDFHSLQHCLLNSMYVGKNVYSPYLRDIYICGNHELTFNSKVVSNEYVRKLCELNDFIDAEKKESFLNEKILNKNCYERKAIK